MSNVNITLRTTEEDSFVVGYPGIPSDGGRPQASVKGTAELRVFPNVMDKVEAKWVRIELKKYETAVFGGVTRSFEEGVGPRYTTLWSSSETKGYGLLVTQDFPFSIRLPESIPPSLENDGGVGIRYELVASACIKGKGGLLRRGKPVIVTTTTPIIIKKHELHSTWPAYNTPEIFETGKKGFKFTVQRNQQCFGPGDRIAARTILTSDISALRTNAVLQDFETSLKEVLTLNIPNTPIHRRETVIARNKIVMNAGVEAGTPFSSDVTCVVPPDYTLATLNALSSRHINITYSFCVKAVLNKTSISLQFPIIISNIERHDSLRLVNHIGTVPGLSDPSPSRSIPSGVTESYTQDVRRSSHSSVQEPTFVSHNSTQERHSSVTSAHVTSETLLASLPQAGDGASSPRPRSPDSIPTTPSSTTPSPLFPPSPVFSSPPSSRRSSAETRTSRLQVMGPRPLPMPPVGTIHQRRSLPAVLVDRAHKGAAQAEAVRRTWSSPASQNLPSMVPASLAFASFNGDSLQFSSTHRPDVHTLLTGIQRTSSAEVPLHIHTNSYQDLPDPVNTDTRMITSPIDISNDVSIQMQERPMYIESAYEENMVDLTPTRLSMKQLLDPLMPELSPSLIPNYNGDIKDHRARYPTSIQVLSNIENQPLSENGFTNANTPYARVTGYNENSTDEEDIYDDPSPEYSSSENLTSHQTRSSSPQSVDTKRETMYTSSSSMQSSRSSPADSTWWSCSSGYEPSYHSNTQTSTASMYDLSGSSLSLNTNFVSHVPNSVRETDVYDQYIARHGINSVSPGPQARVQSYRRHDSTVTQGSDAEDDEDEESPPDYFTSVIMAYYFSQTARGQN